MTDAFRCSTAASAEPLLGTASTVRAFLLVEAPGAWGVDAVLGSRIPPDVRAWLAGLARRHRVRPLMIRGHGRHRSPADGPRVFAAHVGGETPFVETALLDDVAAVLDLRLDGLAAGESPGLTPYDDPLFLVCTHGKHDVCCAEKGRPLSRALQVAAPGQAWEVSHIGGDRFAPNVLVLPHGLYYGRLDPADAADFVDLHRDGRLSLPHLRGRCAFPFPVQAAEIYLRERLGVTTAAPLRLVSTAREGSVTRTVFDVGGAAWEVRVRTLRTEPRRLTCRALTDSAALEHTLLGIARLGS